MKVITQFLDMFTYASAILILGFIIGFVSSPPDIFLLITFALKIIIAVSLIYKFGYKKTSVFTELDRRIIIMLSIFMLVMSFTDLINQFVDDIKKLINPSYQPSTTTRKWF